MKWWKLPERYIEEWSVTFGKCGCCQCHHHFGIREWIESPPVSSFFFSLVSSCHRFRRSTFSSFQTRSSFVHQYIIIFSFSFPFLLFSSSTSLVWCQYTTRRGKCIWSGSCCLLLEVDSLSTTFIWLLIADIFTLLLRVCMLMCDFV